MLWEHKNDMAFFFDMSVNKEWEVEPGCLLPCLRRVYPLKMGSALITCWFCYMCMLYVLGGKGSYGHSGNYIINYACQDVMWPKVIENS